MIWKKRPIFNFNNDDLGNQKRDLSFKLYVLATGEVQKAELIKSSGLTHIDKRVEQSLLRAKFKPYIENGVASPLCCLTALLTQDPERKPKTLVEKASIYFIKKSMFPCSFFKRVLLRLFVPLDGPSVDRYSLSRMDNLPAEFAAIHDAVPKAE